MFSVKFAIIAQRKVVLAMPLCRTQAEHFFENNYANCRLGTTLKV